MEQSSIGRALPLLFCVALTACDNKDAGMAGAPSATPASTGTGAATSKATATATAAMSAAPAALPPGRTAMPTLAEWGSMKEVNVKGSSALKCETKMVREYLRVSCHDKNDTGGTPTTVKMTKGGRGEALLFASAGATSLIIPFVEGTEAEAEFSWTDKSHKLVLWWKKGTPMPPILGSFEGAKSPFDGTADGDAKKLCECHKQVTKSDTCDDMMGGANADCDRTYGGNCQRLLECSRGEPAAMPSCLPGFQLAFANRCYKECGAGGTCATGFDCDKDMLSKPVCVEK